MQAGARVALWFVKLGGSMTVVFTVGLIICVMFCGLSIDIGLLELQKIQMQTAADAAAIAEDMRFERNAFQNGSDGVDGMAAASAHGYTNGVNNTTVTFANNLQTPVVGGDYGGHYDVVQFKITRQTQTLFMGILNNGMVTVTATAVASPPPCNYFLGTKNLVTPTVVLANTAAIAQWYSKCPAYVGGGMFNPAGAWWQAFQTYFTGSAAESTLLGRTKQGTTFNAAAQGDPLASIAQPSVGTCTATNYTHGSMGASSTVALNPGVYCGTVNAGVVTPGMTLLNGTVTFNPGLYVITGGINWQRINATGAGVTFFFTSVGGTAKYGTVSVSNTTNLTLSALTGSAFGVSGTNGAIAGILFFADRNWVNSGPHDFAISLQNGTFTPSGVWYLPYTGMSLQDGTMHCTVYCAIVADNLYLANYAGYMIGSDYTQYSGNNPLRSKTVLVQ